MTGIYTRIHMAHAFTFERATNKESAELEKTVNEAFGVDTLLFTPKDGKFPKFLDSYST